jgi:serine/threonine protein phosphatase PrpC
MTSSIPQRLSTLFKGTVSKDSAFPEANEDKLRACDNRQIYALSDGAGESYNSSLWADVLVESWFTSPPRRNFLRWLKKAIKEYKSRSDTANMSWSQEAAFERGSFASLLALHRTQESDLRVTAVGDSIALVVAGGQVHWSFPYATADQFRVRPHLLSTILSRNLGPFFVAATKAMRENNPAGPCHASVPLRGQEDRLLCVTDALGEWLLRECDDRSERVHRILTVNSEDAFVTLVEEERAAGAMRRDDTTLLILG